MTFLQFDLILLKEKSELLEKMHNIGVEQPPSYYVKPYHNILREKLCYLTKLKRHAPFYRILISVVLIDKVVINYTLLSSEYSSEKGDTEFTAGTVEESRLKER